MTSRIAQIIKENPNWYQIGNGVFGENKSEIAIALVPIGTSRSIDDIHAIARAIAALPDLIDSLEQMFDRFKSLADSGDAGFWKLEDLPEGKKAIDALNKVYGRV